LASAGARPSQLNTRLSAVGSAAVRPAVRWMAISPTFAPAPTSMAATHIAAKVHCGHQVTPSATAAPRTVSATAMRIGWW
jgi:hypothetical protein